jgi:hypothetical protein
VPSGAAPSPHLVTFGTRVRCTQIERRSAFLKKWGRVNVFVLVVGFVCLVASAVA